MQSKQPRRYRAAIIGLGFIGAGDQVSGDRLGQQVSDLDGNHTDALIRHAEVELVAGSSRDAGRRERFATRTHCRTYADWREMLATEQPEIVSVATNAPQHAEMVIACAATGVAAVYCEKPLATNLTDGEAMLAACRAANTLLAVNHNRRFHPNFIQLRAAVERGDLGQLTSGLVQWGTGRLANVGTHFIDAILFGTGLRIEAVSGTLDRVNRLDCRGEQFYDPGGWGWLQLQGRSGMTPPMIAVDAASAAELPAILILNGTQGRITMHDKIGKLERPLGQLSQTWQSSTDATSMDATVAAIVAALNVQLPYPHSPDDALHVLEGIVAIHASHLRCGAVVQLPLTGQDRQIALHCA